MEENDGSQAVGYLLKMLYLRDNIEDPQQVFVSFPHKRNGFALASGVNYSGDTIQSE